MLLQNFQTHIEANKLFKPDMKILLAVSGGIDSVVMAKLFYDSNYWFEIAHCNFQLRGKDSELDELFVAKIAQKYNVNFHTTKFNTQYYADNKHLSIQIAARKLRYDWFNKLKGKNNFEFVATAHHANDQLETMLFNLSKGTGLSGLRGIPVNKNGYVRPMIFASKKEILSFAEDHKLTWREDSSNISVKYKRNLIRRKVVPVLEQINPALIKQLIFTTERLEAAENVLKDLFVKFKEKSIQICINGELRISINDLLNTPSPLLVLDELLKSYGFVYKQTRQILSQLNQESGKMFLSNTHVLLIDRSYLILREIRFIPNEIVEIQENTKEIKISNLTLQIEKVNATKDYKFPRDKNIGCFDHNLLKFPLKIRKWEEGDFFIPIGMKGKKKVSNFLTDIKLNLFEKQNIYVLCSGEQIIWIIGYRPDDRFKITDYTKILYKVEIF